jgi:hypothetical protein
LVVAWVPDLEALLQEVVCRVQVVCLVLVDVVLKVRPAQPREFLDLLRNLKANPILFGEWSRIEGEEQKPKAWERRC